jgi:DNA-binding transcriptional LysR family regulator
MDQLMAMRAFTRVVESGSFTRAADSLNMPIATLSKLVKSLESHLEIRLLHRTTRRVVATPEGMEYYEKALRVLIDIEDIDTSFRVSRATPKGICGLTWAAPPPGTCSSPASGIYAALPGYPHRPWRGRPAGRSHQR